MESKKKYEYELLDRCERKSCGAEVNTPTVLTNAGRAVFDCKAGNGLELIEGAACVLQTTAGDHRNLRV